MDQRYRWWTDKEWSKNSCQVQNPKVETSLHRLHFRRVLFQYDRQLLRPAVSETSLHHCWRDVSRKIQCTENIAKYCHVIAREWSLTTGQVIVIAREWSCNCNCKGHFDRWQERDESSSGKIVFPVSFSREIPQEVCTSANIVDVVGLPMS